MLPRLLSFTFAPGGDLTIVENSAILRLLRGQLLRNGNDGRNDFGNTIAALVATNNYISPYPTAS